MFKATHTKLVNCDGPKDKEDCFPVVNLDEESYFTDELKTDDGKDIYFSNAEEPPYEFEKIEVTGELSEYNNNGYYKTFPP